MNLPGFQEWNYIDLVLALIVAAGMVVGWLRGFVAGVLGLLVLVACFIAAFAGYPWLAHWFEAELAFLGVWALPLAFVLVFVVARVVIGALASAVSRAFPPRAHTHGINRFLGLAPGLADGLINASVVALLLLAIPMLTSVTAKVHESVLAQRLAAPAEWLQGKLTPIFSGAVGETFNLLTEKDKADKAVRPERRAKPGAAQHVQGTQRITLTYTVTDATPRQDLEESMLALVNQERSKEGLRPLKADPDLTQVARAHSRDMFARGYFSHGDPQGNDAFDRMRAANIRYITAGENLALAPTLAVAHTGLMNSPGHRANILRPAYGRVGIGVLDGGRRGLMVTQNFRN